MYRFIKVQKVDNTKVLIDVTCISMIEEYRDYSSITVVHSSSSLEYVHVLHTLDVLEEMIQDATEIDIDDDLL